MGNKNKQRKRTSYFHSVNEYCLARSGITSLRWLKLQSMKIQLRLPAHSNGIPTTCRLEMEFFSQLRNNAEVTGLPVCHVM